MSFVLDAATALSWAFGDQRDEASLGALRRLRGGEALVPSIWGLEVANGLAMAERWGRISAAESARFTRLLRALPITEVPTEPGRPLEALLRLARDHDVSVYGAAYLDVALRYGVPLVTRDERVGAAARRQGVPVA